MSSKEITLELLRRYRELQNRLGSEPSWAVHKRTEPERLVRCPVPFVGENYSSQEKKILVYASAENLSWYDYDKDYSDKDYDDILDCDAKAENRHRLCFDLCKNKFFPNVHIAPLSNGCLLTAVYYIAKKLFLKKDVSPREFYEMIAVANFGKFSIETERQRAYRTETFRENISSNRNVDYAKDKFKLEASYDFIAADLETLKPDIIIMPQAIYNTAKTVIAAHKGNAKIVPIYQMNAGTINRVLSGKDGDDNTAYKYKKRAEYQLPNSVKVWYKHIGEREEGEKGKSGDIIGKTKDNYLRVFSYIDEILENSLKE